MPHAFSSQVLYQDVEVTKSMGHIRIPSLNSCIVRLSSEESYMLQKQMVDAVKLADEAMIGELAIKSMEAMTERLQQTADQGKTQWWNPNVCTISHLRDRATFCVESGNFLDAMNLCAMVVYRERSGA